jgi:hypothetical protein
MSDERRRGDNRAARRAWPRARFEPASSGRAPAPLAARDHGVVREEAADIPTLLVEYRRRLEYRQRRKSFEDWRAGVRDTLRSTPLNRYAIAARCGSKICCVPRSRPIATSRRVMFAGCRGESTRVRGRGNSFSGPRRSCGGLARAHSQSRREDVFSPSRGKERIPASCIAQTQQAYCIATRLPVGRSINPAISHSAIGPSAPAKV